MGKYGYREGLSFMIKTLIHMNSDHSSCPWCSLKSPCSFSSSVVLTWWSSLANIHCSHLQAESNWREEKKNKNTLTICLWIGSQGKNGHHSTGVTFLQPPGPFQKGHFTLHSLPLHTISSPSSRTLLLGLWENKCQGAAKPSASHMPSSVVSHPPFCPSSLQSPLGDGTPPSI